MGDAIEDGQSFTDTIPSDFIFWGHLGRPGGDQALAAKSAVVTTLASEMAALIAPTIGADAAAAATARAGAQTAQAGAETAQADAETFAALAEAWATKTTGIAGDSEYSSKAWAIGGSGVTGTASRGAAKEWATQAAGSLVDGADYSAKHYAAQAATSAAAVGTVVAGNQWIDATLSPYSADKTGTSDARSAIQSALTAAGLLGGGTVYLPAGTYKITGGVYLPTGVRLVGAGKGATTLRRGAGSTGAGTTQGGKTVYCSVAMVGVRAAGVYNLSIDHKTNTVNSNGVQIGESGAATRSTDCVVDSIEVTGYNEHHYYIYNKCADRTWIRNNTVIGHTSIPSTDTAGIEVYGGVGVLVEGNDISYCAPGITTFQETVSSDSDLYDVRILGNRVTSCYNGIHIISGTDMTTKNVVVSGNTVRACTNRGIFVGLSSTGAFENVKIAGNTVVGVGSSAVCICVDSGGTTPAGVKNLAVSGNATSQSLGLLVNGAVGLHAVGNEFSSVSGNSLVSIQNSSKVRLCGNVLEDTTGHAVELYTVANSEFGGNILRDYEGSGFKSQDTGSSYLTFNGNVYKWRGAETVAVSCSNVTNCVSHNETLLYPPALTPFAFGTSSSFDMIGASAVDVSSSTTQNNLAIPDVACVRFNGATGAWQITGIGNGFVGRKTTFFNNTGQTLTLKNDNTGSSAGKRLICKGYTDVTVPAYSYFTAEYQSINGADLYWLVG